MSSAEVLRELEVLTFWQRRRCTYSYAIVECAKVVRSQFPCLRDIHFVTENVYRSRSGLELLTDLGYQSKDAFYWDDSSDSPYRTTTDDVRGSSGGGCLMFIRQQDNIVRPSMFLAVPDEQTTLAHAAVFSSIVHEAGHLDDFTKQLHLRVGGADLAAAERHAFLYQIETLHAGGHAMALFVALNALQQSNSKAGDSGYKTATLSVLDNPTTTRAIEWLNELLPGMANAALKRSSAESGLANAPDPQESWPEE